MPARRIAAMAGLLFVAVATFVPIGKLGAAYTGLGKPWGTEPLWWALAAALLFYVVIVEREKLSSIGFRKTGIGGIALGLLAGVIIFFGVGALLGVIFPIFHLKANTATTASLTSAPLLYRIAIVTRAAVVEEIIFRGYGMERLKSLTGSWTIAAVVTLAAFTYAHLAGWGLAHLIIAGSAGAALTLLYLWRRNLWINIAAHWVVDGAALILMPLLAHH